MVSIDEDIIFEMIILLRKNALTNGTLIWTHNPMYINMEDLTHIGEGGYASVYRSQDGKIIKIIKSSGYSEMAAIYRSNKDFIRPIESIVGDQIIDLYNYKKMNAYMSE